MRHNFEKWFVLAIALLAINESAFAKQSRCRSVSWSCQQESAASQSLTGTTTNHCVIASCPKPTCCFPKPRCCVPIQAPAEPAAHKSIQPDVRDFEVHDTYLQRQALYGR